jgi:hypothetical protein
MTTNILELDQVYTIADRVYWEILDELGIEDKCIYEVKNEGTRNTDFGEAIYFRIEEAVKEAVNFDDELGYTCPKFEPTEN